MPAVVIPGLPHMTRSNFRATCLCTYFGALQLERFMPVTGGGLEPAVAIHGLPHMFSLKLYGPHTPVGSLCPLQGGPRPAVAINGLPHITPQTTGRLITRSDPAVDYALTLPRWRAACCAASHRGQCVPVHRGAPPPWQSQDCHAFTGTCSTCGAWQRPAPRTGEQGGARESHSACTPQVAPTSHS